MTLIRYQASPILILLGDLILIKDKTIMNLKLIKIVIPVIAILGGLAACADPATPVKCTLEFVLALQYCNSPR
jgi:hypothetical protein